MSSTLIDRVARALGREVREVPVGFKWFVPGLVDGSLGFGGEESAGASFLCRDGRTWTTDKDGIILDLLAAEITAVTGKDPGVHYERLREEFGTSYYTRVDAPATPAEKTALGKLSPEAVTATTMAGDPIVAKLTKAPGNGASIGGLKVASANGWFAARPSARRTSTRSTPRAWSAPITWRRSWARRARSWGARWRVARLGIVHSSTGSCRTRIPSL